MFCLATLQRQPVRCPSGWLLNVLCTHHPPTVPVSLCPFALRVSLSPTFHSAGLSLSVFRSLHPPKGVCPSPYPPKGVSLPLRPPHGFLSVPLFPVSLPRLTPPSACRFNSGISPFAWRRAQQRVKEPHSVPCDRVCLPEECFLKQTYQISSARQPHVRAVSIPTH